MELPSELDLALADAVNSGCQDLRRSMPREILAARSRVAARRFMHRHPRAGLYLLDGGPRHAQVWGHERETSGGALANNQRSHRLKTPDFDSQLELDDRAESHLEVVAGRFLSREYRAFERTVRRVLDQCDERGIGSAVWTWVALYGANTRRMDLEFHAYSMIAKSRFEPVRIAGLLNGALRSHILRRDSGAAEPFVAALGEESPSAIMRVSRVVREMNVRRYGESRVGAAERELQRTASRRNLPDGLWSAGR
ncbi:hypothetical protein Poly30_28580 [Planctomycetes bacterium Poly30]|uniref:Uncharacterized protein n=1 Tax=Saltatorellus ferox TaxID=2528018 RepID=A0A518ETB7_9BACT|nr:hypothetical protein Poly30_28580 [Planctomycetes bacterium Poly30]